MPAKSPRPRASKGRALSSALSKWTKTKREAFLAELALTSNVTKSAHSVKLSEQGAYKLRRTDEAFRLAWKQALAEGYARLEHMMLERAMKSFSAQGKAADPARTKMDDYSNKLAMTLLTAHRAAVRGESAVKPAPASKSDDVRTRLETRFASMRARMGVDDNGAA